MRTFKTPDNTAPEMETRPGLAAGTRTEKAYEPRYGLHEIAKRVRDLSIANTGAGRQVHLFGHSNAMVLMLQRMEKFARFNEPILIQGESGSGKEWVAQGCHLLSQRAEKPFVAVNCPQYQDGNLVVSELFGHVKGSFTGAIRDHKGHFETANGGSIFLDEVADLHMAAQTMLLRSLQEQEFKPVGSERTVRTNIRLISATNRPLREMIHSAEFREDLYFRIRYFPIEVPALREREDDWRYIAAFFLARLADEYGIKKRLSQDSINELTNYHWPGNIRELKSIVTIGYSMANGEVIEPEHFTEALRRDEKPDQVVPTYSRVYLKMVKEGATFWDELYTKFMNRDLNRREAAAVIRRGLIQTRGSYQGLVKLFNMPKGDYQKFMDFLRHHDLKPSEKGFQ